MMLDNLINTWQLLAPVELPEPAFLDYRYVGYIQNCINKRGWSWSLSCESGVRFTATIENAPETYPYPTPTEALMTAYLTALAVRRPIKQGTHWRHYKGGLMEVAETAEWAGLDLTKEHIVRFPQYISSLGEFLLEESFYPSVELVKNAAGTCFYIANRDYGERIFYQHDSNNWARPISDFLGLTQDGLLRFVEGNDKST
jgi:hypothetical protein